MALNPMDAGFWSKLALSYSKVLTYLLAGDLASARQTADLYHQQSDDFDTGSKLVIIALPKIAALQFADAETLLKEAVIWFQPAEAIIDLASKYWMYMEHFAVAEEMYFSLFREALA